MNNERLLKLAGINENAIPQVPNQIKTKALQQLAVIPLPSGMAPEEYYDWDDDATEELSVEVDGQTYIIVSMADAAGTVKKLQKAAKFFAR